jgi:hypothetical protein
MTRFAEALALVDALAQEGARIDVAPDGGLDLDGDLSEALSAWLAAFCAGPEVERSADALEAQLEAATAGARASDGCDSQPLDALLGAARDASPRYRALRAIARAPSRAARELLTLPVAYAIGLPHPFTLTFVREGRICVASTSREMYGRAQSQGHIVFVLRELEAAALAVAQGRAGARAFDGWLDRKACGDFRLTPELVGVLGHVRDPSEPADPGLTFGELFEALDAEIVSVDVHELVAPREGAA